MSERGDVGFHHINPPKPWSSWWTLDFNVYTREIPYVAGQALSLQFADAIGLTCCKPTKSEVSAILSASASAIANWLNDRGLILNASKSQAISISGNLPEKHTPLSVNCNGTLLPLVESARYLGVTLDSNMSWDDRVTRCANRVSHQSPVEDAEDAADLLLWIKCILDISGSQARSSTSAKPRCPCSVWTSAMDIRT